MIKEVFALVKKEWLLETRAQSTLAGILVYIFSSLFISYLSFKQIIDVSTWNALFWLLILFTAVNAVAKSFLSESSGVQLFYYSLLNPQAVIISKIIYNGLMLFILGLFTWLFYGIFLGSPVQDHAVFTLTLLLGCFGFSSVLSMVSAIASRAGQQSSFMAILGFPILLPILIIVIHLSKNAIDGIALSINLKYITMLLAMNFMVPALAFILFPYLWRE